MTQEQIKLRDELIKELEERGFTFRRYLNCGRGAELTMDNDCYEENMEGWGFTTLNGLTIDIEETYHNNNKQENKSFYVTAKRLRNSSGKGIERVKISQNDGIRKRTNAINKVVDAYMEARKEN